MWIRAPKYPLKSQLPAIARHDQLPAGAHELARLEDTVSTAEDLWLLVYNNGGLSLLSVCDKLLANGQPFYLCSQSDFPLAFLAWFHPALVDFKKPPAEGGLPAGAMASGDQNVGGEMLNLQRALGIDGGRGGYCVSNYSRCVRGKDADTHFTPQECMWSDRLLNEGGLLQLIDALAAQHALGHF